MQAPEQMKERDVFKGSHDKQAEAIEQQAGAPSNPSESAQVTLLYSPHHVHASYCFQCSVACLSTSPWLLVPVRVSGSTLHMQRGLDMGVVTCRTSTRWAMGALSTILMAVACLPPKGRGLLM